jgi:hypothetical protein
MEVVILKIEQALADTIGMDSERRQKATDFLLQECEPDPQFQLALLHIIKTSGGNPQKATV